jgi:hypothetical protein
MMVYYNGNKTDCLNKLFNAHYIIFDINERIKKLYESAESMSGSMDGMPRNPNPKRFEGSMVEIIYLKDYGRLLLKKRAAFDVFLCTLSSFDYSLLNLRCEECRSWKETAGALGISIDTARRYFEKICELAEEQGLFESGFNKNNDEEEA